MYLYYWWMKKSVFSGYGWFVITLIFFFVMMCYLYRRSWGRVPPQIFYGPLTSTYISSEINWCTSVLCTNKIPEFFLRYMSDLPLGLQSPDSSPPSIHNHKINFGLQSSCLGKKNLALPQAVTKFPSSHI